MKIVTIKKVENEPDPNTSGVMFVKDYADFLVCQLILQGPGSIESRFDADTPTKIEWLFTPRRASQQKSVHLSSISFFRPLLACFGWKYLDNAYGGHIRFGIQFEGESEPRPELFSLYQCNEMETACWLKIYLYSIAGVWPFPEMTQKSAE